MSKIIALARSRGSHATTHAGAWRYLLRSLTPPPARRNTPRDADDVKIYWRKRDERRAQRICAALGLPVRPYDAERAALLAQLTPPQLSSACERCRGIQIGCYRYSGSEVIREILRRIGPAGEQARADEERYFEQYEDRDEHKNGRRIDLREISRAVIAPDCSAAILSYVEIGGYTDFVAARYGGRSGLHHLRISAYLVVRDHTTGERHILRIPPRFGATRSATWRRHEGDPSGLIHEATAWTFGLRPSQYHPEVAA